MLEERISVDAKQRPLHKKAAAAMGLFMSGLVLLAGIYRMQLLVSEAASHAERRVGRSSSSDVVLQRRFNTCGPTGLYMVLERHGVRADLKLLEREADPGVQGTSFARLCEMARKRGLGCAGWRLTFEDLRRAKLPAMVLLRGRHLVVVEEISGRGIVRISDPARGRRIVSERSFRRQWNGETLLFQKTTHGTERFPQRGGDGE